MPINASGIRPFALLAQWGGLGLAATYFANGLTRDDARVRVTQAASSHPQDVDPGQFTPQHLSGIFYFQGLEGVDRATSRLGVILTWLVVALIGYALQRQARLFALVSPTWLVVRSPYTTTLAVGIASLGFAPQVGTGLASSAVLQAAGSPAALSPQFTLEPGWIAAGLGYAIIVAAASRSRTRTAAAEDAGRIAPRS